MFAETAKLNLEVENIYNDEIIALLADEAKVDELGGIIIKGKINLDNPTEADIAVNNNKLIYIFENIDCGIEERSVTQVALDKQISNIKLTLSDNTVLANINFDIDYEDAGKNDDGSHKYKARVKVNKDTSVGFENLQAVNKDERNGLQNFRYLNVDENIMQGAVIAIEYKMTALNIGEVDRTSNTVADIATAEEIVELANALKAEREEYKNDRKIGTYLGSVYYNGSEAKGDDTVVSTKIRQLIDYVDNDAVFAQLDNMGRDHSWTQVLENELIGVKDGNYDGTLEYTNRILSPGVVSDNFSYIIDKDNRYYNTDKKNNIILSLDNEADEPELTNIGFMTELKPVAFSEESYKSQMTL